MFNAISRPRAFSILKGTGIAAIILVAAETAAGMVPRHIESQVNGQIVIDCGSKIGEMYQGRHDLTANSPLVLGGHIDQSGNYLKDNVRAARFDNGDIYVSLTIPQDGNSGVSGFSVREDNSFGFRDGTEAYSVDLLPDGENAVVEILCMAPEPSLPIASRR